jgi:molybdopterin/thiamine biosynthesis adenylyltransferase
MDTNTYNRFDRQQRIKGWQQDKVAAATILVLGAGALGNEVVKNLALTGAGHIIIADMDTIELSNLSRTVLFREKDIGRYKAEALATAARALNPLLKTTFINGNILFDIGLGFYREADLVIGCLDNLIARIHANTSAAMAGKPYLDTAISEQGGEVRWFFPGNSACFGCSVDTNDPEVLAARYSCTGYRDVTATNTKAVMPTTIAPAAVIAGIAVQQACFYLGGLCKIPAGEAIVFNGLTTTLHRSVLSRNPACVYHADGPYVGVQQLALSATSTTAWDLMTIAATELGNDVTLELGRDLLAGFYCSKCGKNEAVDKLLYWVKEESRLCPGCGSKRDKQLLTSVTRSHHYSNRSLISLGVPAGEVLCIYSAAGTALYQLHQDITNLFYPKK